MISTSPHPILIPCIPKSPPLRTSNSIPRVQRRRASAPDLTFYSYPLDTPIEDFLPEGFLDNKRQAFDFNSPVCAIDSPDGTTVASLSTIVDHNRLRSNLNYIDLTSNRKFITSLVDSGSAVNVMSSEVASQLKYDIISHPPITLSSCTGSSMPIKHWGQADFHLNNNQTVNLTFVVVDSLPWQFILGLPFFHTSRLLADFANGFLTNKHGPVPMYSRAQDRSRHPSVNAIDVESLNETDREAYETLMECSKTNEFPDIADNLRSTLWAYRDTWSSKQPSQCSVLSHIIEPTTKRALVERPRRHSLDHIEVHKKELAIMEKDSIIKPSCSDYATEIVLTRRSNGPWRLCIDFRLLNKHTKIDKYPLPRISTLLQSIRDSEVFCALDLRAGYWNIRLDPESTKYTAFRTPNGLYEFVVMPFGLVNAPATFQRVMDFIFQDLYDQGLAVYLDDILIHGKSVDHVFRLLEVVLQRLRNFGLRLNLSKSKFFQKMLLYLGHIVSEGSIRPNPKKVEALHNLRPAKDAPEVRKIMGAFGYFRQYIPSFADYSHFLTDLLKKNVPFEWNENHQFALEFCAHQLSTAVLALPLSDDEFVLETDASNYAIGAILSVRRNNQLIPVEFASATLKGAELR